MTSLLSTWENSSGRAKPPGFLLSDNLPVRVRKELQNVVQLLQCYLRAAELEMRAAEEPLKSDLDVAGFKAQVLGRI